MSNIMANPNLWERVGKPGKVTDNWDGEAYLFDARGGGYQVGMRNISYSPGDTIAYRIDMLKEGVNMPGSDIQMTRNGAAMRGPGINNGSTYYPQYADHSEFRSNVFFATGFFFQFNLESLDFSGNGPYQMEGGFFKLTPLYDGDELVSAFWTDEVLCKDR